MCVAFSFVFYEAFGEMAFTTEKMSQEEENVCRNNSDADETWSQGKGMKERWENKQQRSISKMIKSGPCST